MIENLFPSHKGLPLGPAICRVFGRAATRFSHLSPSPRVERSPILTVETHTHRAIFHHRKAGFIEARPPPGSLAATLLRYRDMTAEQVNEVVREIRERVRGRYQKEVAQDSRFLAAGARSPRPRERCRGGQIGRNRHRQSPSSGFAQRRRAGIQASRLRGPCTGSCGTRWTSITPSYATWTPIWKRPSSRTTTC